MAEALVQPSLTERLDRYRDVLWRPHARLYCAPDTFHALLRYSQPGSTRGPQHITDRVPLICDERLSPGTVVCLALVPPLPPLSDKHKE